MMSCVFQYLYNTWSGVFKRISLQGTFGNSSYFIVFYLSVFWRGQTEATTGWAMHYKWYYEIVTLSSIYSQSILFNW